MPANIEKALPHFCLANSGISALISDKFYPRRLPQGTILPAAAFQLISTNSVQTHNSPSFLPRQRFQLTYYGGTYDICKQVAIAFKNALDGYKGNMGIGDYITRVEGVLFKDEREDENLELPMYWRQQDYLIMWIE